MSSSTSRRGRAAGGGLTRRRRGVGKRTRQVLVFLHVSTSLGWLGAGAANVVLAVTAAHTSSPELRRVSYELIDRIDFGLVIPLAFATLVGGVLVSLATPWGLIRYWWVLVKLVLTLAVIVFSTFGVGVWVELSIQATASADAVSPAGLQLIRGAGANIVCFVFMSFISFVKPWGPTPWSRGVSPAGGDRGSRGRRRGAARYS